jgi:uncharacterized protein (DUF488 family)
MNDPYSDRADARPTKVWTIGHSTRDLATFQELLIANGIKTLIDVRSYPASRRCPQFNQAELFSELRAIDISYHHLSGLGGRRKPQPRSKNTAWRNESFRAYADHMESDDFKQGINALLELTGQGNTAVMCAEAVWWRCHRGLIADHLKARGVEVIHILDAGRTEIHPYTAAARIVDGELCYAGLLPEEV